MFRRGRFERQAIGVLGRASLAARLCSSCLPITSLGRDRPRRLILPMTALRVTPISLAVWPHERPALRQRFSSSMRSEVQVVHFADMLIALAPRVIGVMSRSEDAGSVAKSWLTIR